MTKMKNIRNLKVYGTSGYHYKTTPTIMLKGQWLSELGFDEGDHIKVDCENGKLTITREEIAIQVAEEPSRYGRRR